MSSSHSGGPNDQPGPVLASRAFAMTSAAMYDAYNSIERIGQRYLISVPNAGNADSDAAVAQAAHDRSVGAVPEPARHLRRGAGPDAAAHPRRRRGEPRTRRRRHRRRRHARRPRQRRRQHLRRHPEPALRAQRPARLPQRRPAAPRPGLLRPRRRRHRHVRHPRLRAVRPRPPRRPGRRLGPHQHRRLPAHAGLRGGLRRGQAPRRRRGHHADPAHRRADG